MKHPHQPFEPGVEYVLGFAFSDRSVLLIRKNRPAWQANLLNGVGGKVEPADWSLDEAMRREFKEETGIDTEVGSWVKFAQHLKPGKFNGDPDSYSLHVFTTRLDNDQIEQLNCDATDEKPQWFELDFDMTELFAYGVPGCAMYVLMALNHIDTQLFTTTTESA
jgi:8-oxo-dGTP pyrophosphatase MutT (NUDIX family)